MVNSVCQFHGEVSNVKQCQWLPKFNTLTSSSAVIKKESKFFAFAVKAANAQKTLHTCITHKSRYKIASGMILPVHSNPQLTFWKNWIITERSDRLRMMTKRGKNWILLTPSTNSPTHLPRQRLPAAAQRLVTDITRPQTVCSRWEDFTKNFMWKKVTSQASVRAAITKDNKQT